MNPSNSVSSSSTHAGPVIHRTGVVARSIAPAFATALAVWVIAFVGRLPSVYADGPVMLGLLLGALVLAALVVGFTSGVRVAAMAALLAGLVNVLLVASVVSSASLPDDPTVFEPNRVTMQGFVWIPGSLIAALAIGVVGGGVGAGLARLAGRRLSPGARLPLAAGHDPHRAAQAFVAILSTLCLITIGALVTSLEAGLAVPDWPTSYGYNMFLYPYTKMVGGIYYEHAHRLMGTFVGLQLIVLCLWAWTRPGTDRALVWLSSNRCGACGHTRGHDAEGEAARRCPECGAEIPATGATAPRWPALPGANHPRRMAFLASAALLLVCVQGMLGGFRVTWVNLFGHNAALILAMAHALTAQIFLLSLTMLAWANYAAWRAAAADVAPGRAAFGPVERTLGVVLVISILGQTMLGAVLRHLGPEWSLLAHMLGAVVVVLLALTLVTAVMGGSDRPRHRRPAMVLLGLSVFQALLGAAAWWVTTRYDRQEQVTSGLLASVTAGHVVVGAALLLIAWWLTLEVFSASPTRSIQPGKVRRRPVLSGDSA